MKIINTGQLKKNSNIIIKRLNNHSNKIQTISTCLSWCSRIWASCWHIDANAWTLLASPRGIPNCTRAMVTLWLSLTPSSVAQSVIYAHSLSTIRLCIMIYAYMISTMQSAYHRLVGPFIATHRDWSTSNARSTSLCVASCRGTK